MPELPEVETIVRTLRPSLLGRTIDGLRLLRKDIIHPLGYRPGVQKLCSHALSVCFDAGRKLSLNLTMPTGFTFISE